MAHYTGIDINVVWLSDPIIYNLTEVPLFPLAVTDTGTYTKGTFSVIGKSYAAVDAEVTWGVSRLGKGFFNPSTIDAGLIGTNQIHTLYFWNAGIDNLILTDIQTNNPAGYTITGPGIGSMAGPETELTWVLTITTEGPPTQDTVLTFVFLGGAEYTVEFTGRRIEVLAFPINAVDGLDITYHWETVLYRNEKYKEQRRALRETPYRTLKARFSFLDDLLQRERFLNQLYLYQNKIIAIPYMIEEMAITGDPQGGTTINLASGEASNRFELDTAPFCIIYDERDGSIKELVEVDSIAGDVINIAGPVFNSYDHLYSYVAPAFLCYVPVPEMSLLTARTAEFTVEFQEYY